MRRLLPVLSAVLAAAPAAAQQLAERVAAVRNGQAVFTFASRPDVCGDGRMIIMRWLELGSQMVMFSSDWGMTTGSWDMTNHVCTHGPVQVQLTIRDRQIRTLSPSVGGSTGPRGTNIGTVSTQTAVDFLLDFARTAPEDLSSRALLAAAIADSVRISARLIDLASDRRLAPDNREQALKWLERTAQREGNTAADARVRAIAADETDNPDVRERAIRVVAHTAGDAFLRDLYRRLTFTALKERVIRVVGETGNADAIEWLRSIAVDRSEPQEARERALRVLGEQAETPYLRQVYGRLDNTDLRERVLRALGEAGGAENLRFLRRVALDSSAVTDLRDRALRVLSEAGVATTDLVALYDAIRDSDLRDRLIRLLAERGDRDARAKLAEIATNDPNPDLRERARRKRQ